VVGYVENLTLVVEFAHTVESDEQQYQESSLVSHPMLPAVIFVKRAITHITWKLFIDACFGFSNRTLFAPP
jgi:hypothetical protein